MSRLNLPKIKGSVGVVVANSPHSSVGNSSSVNLHLITAVALNRLELARRTSTKRESAHCRSYGSLRVPPQQLRPEINIMRAFNSYEAFK